MSQSKEQLRICFQLSRKKVPLIRKEGAKKELCDHLFSKLQKFRYVLSYSPLSHEVDISLLNRALASQGKLCLPKVEGVSIQAYLIKDLERDVKRFQHVFFEPDPSRCEKIDGTAIESALLPGIAFDKRGNRLGFGKGCYDRFIELYPNIYSFGILYREQLYDGSLPVEAHDKRVSELCIV